MDIILKYFDMSKGDIPTFAVTALSLCACIAIYFLVKNLASKYTMKCCKSTEAVVTKEGRKLGRRMSFTSASMAMGAFPEEANVCEPIINVALMYESGECPEMKDLMEMAKTILTYERCAGIPVGTPGKKDWRFRECRDVNPRKLIRIIDINGDDKVMYDAIGDHMQDSLREGRGDLPWWEFLVFKNEGSGKNALMFRVEHCIADGLSIVTLFEHFITYTDGTPMEGLIPKSMNKKFQRKGGKLSLYLKAFKATFKVLTLPSSKFDDPVAFKKNMGNGMVYTGKRKALIFNTVPLEFVKTLKNVAKVSLNDVLFTCLSQAIHDYCVLQNCSVMKAKGNKAQFRALMPVAFPRPAEETKDRTRTMRNKWVFVSSDMGVGFDDIMDRLQYVHEHLNELKNSPLAFCQWKVQESIPPKLPLKLARQTVYDSFVRHSLVFSNVPGPHRQCNIAGKKTIGTQMFFNNLIPQVGILSYYEQIFMNIVLDPEAIPDSDSIPIFYSRALVTLAQQFNVDIPVSVEEHAKQTW